MPSRGRWQRRSWAWQVEKTGHSRKEGSLRAVRLCLSRFAFCDLHHGWPRDRRNFDLVLLRRLCASVVKALLRPSVTTAVVSISFFAHLIELNKKRKIGSSFRGKHHEIAGFEGLRSFLPGKRSFCARVGRRHSDSRKYQLRRRTSHFSESTARFEINRLGRAPTRAVSRHGNGKAEILLTPGVFLRAGDNSTVEMVSA